jgi:hypothetical protein
MLDVVNTDKALNRRTLRTCQTYVMPKRYGMLVLLVLRHVQATYVCERQNRVREIPAGPRHCGQNGFRVPRDSMTTFYCPTTLGAVQRPTLGAMSVHLSPYVRRLP